MNRPVPAVTAAPLLQQSVRYTLMDVQDRVVEQDWHAHAGTEDVIVLDGWLEVHYREPESTGLARARTGQRVTIPANLEHRVLAQGLFESFLPPIEYFPAVVEAREQG